MKNKTFLDTRTKKIVMVGAFPPPVHGMAAVNEAVRDALCKMGSIPIVMDLAARSLDRSMLARLWRLPRVLVGLVRMIFMGRLRGATLYMSISGGLGQVYEILFLFLSRLRGLRVYLHHHSFAYIDTYSLLTLFLVRLAGSDAVHITLSRQMSERMQVIYGVTNTISISNAVFFVDAETTVSVRSRLKTLGFLSNISAEKGVFKFLDLCEAAQDKGLSLHARLAGPFQDDKTESEVRERLSALPNVEYVGPQYGESKDAFFSSIDVLVFPTCYVNEAEPVTLHEAMSQGVPVIAYGRGSIPEIVVGNSGKVVDPAESFGPVALAQIELWDADPASFQSASRAASRCFSETYLSSQVRWHVLRHILTGKKIDESTMTEVESS